jgi:DNA-binding beta-propeller fold protein YncE
MTLTHDDKMLIAASGSGAAILDLPGLVSGQTDAVLGYLNTASEVPPDTARYLDRQRIGLRHAAEIRESGSIQVNVTGDDRILFIADEWTESITVVDVRKAKDSHFGPSSIMGKIPVGVLPIALVFSPDERYLYTTSEIAPQAYGWPVECKPEGNDPTVIQPENPQGVVLVVDVKKAKSNPTGAVIAKVPAGCTAVRLAISPKGDRAFVTARNSNAVLAFETRRLISDPAHALLGTVPVGTAPVGLAMFDGGRKLIATNSNRFAGDANDRQSLTVIDPEKISSGAAAVRGQIPAGAFPRELTVTSDQRTLLVTNFGSKTLEVIDLARLSLGKP